MYVTISDAYAVRNEQSGSFLIRVEKIIDSNIKDFSTFCIPPFMGYILAHIGDLEYDEAIREISKALGISSRAIDKFVGQLVENAECKEFLIDNGHSVVLPPHLLVKNEYKSEANIYEEYGFDGKGDFEIKRPSFPINANFMVTTNCTTDCMYCYANRKISPVMSTEKILSLLDELHDGGTINLTLTGGDIFAHPDWLSILKRVRTLGYKPFLSTKTPLNGDQIKTLVDLGYGEIQFSLDSANPEILSSMINAKKDYLENVGTFLDNCTKQGLNVMIRSVLTKLNASIQYISRTYEFLSHFSCVKEWAMTPVFFSPYKKNMYGHFEIDNLDLVEVYKFSKRKDIAFPVLLNKISKEGYVLKKTDDVEDYVCNNQICMGNTTCISILANGDCSVCEMLYDNPEYLLGNVAHTSVKEIWNSKKALDLYNIRQEEILRESPCSDCSVFEKCRRGFGKRVCYLDIAKTGKSKHFPDPRCPKADDCNLVL